MKRLVLAAAALALIACTGASAAGRTQTLLSTPHRITQFAQDGNWIAFSTKDKRCGPHVHLFSLRTRRLVSIRPTGFSVTCDVYSGLAVAGDRALWTDLVGAGNTELDVAIETASASAPSPRRIREMAIERSDFGPDPATPVVAGRAHTLVYYRNESGILTAATHDVERFAGRRPARLFRIVDPVALAVDGGRIASARRQLVRGDACNCNFTPAWSPDGARIAFASGDVCCVTDSETADIYVVGADGSGRARITFDGRPKLGVAWSPDGSKLAYGYLKAHFGPMIAIVGADGSAPHDVVAGEYPSFSPDGSQLTFDSNGKIQIASTDGSGVRTIASGTNPAWSPSGSRIAFESDDGAVETVDTSGGSPQGMAPLVNQPAWSHDGTSLAGFADSKRRGLFVEGPTGSGFIPGTQATDGHPSFSPDGTKIVFDSLRNQLVPGEEQRPELYVTNLDGSNMHALTYTKPDEWTSVIQVHSSSGRSLSTRTASGAPLGVAISGRYLVALTQATVSGAKQLEISDATSGKLLRTVLLGSSSADGPLYAAGGRVAYRAGRSLMLLNLRTGVRRRIAVLDGVVGFALAGNRFYWAENTAHGGRIRSFAIPR